MSLRAQQLAFAAHLRDPAGQPPPTGVDERRLAVYRELFFNNVLGFMRNGFPVIRRVLGDDALAALVRAWFAGHRAREPVFPRLPGEFVAWLAGAPAAAADAPPWLAELAHYEWVELELQLDPAEVDAPGVDRRGGLIRRVPALSPLVRVLSYRWPVHRIGPDFRPPAPDPVTLLVYRDRDDDVHFVQTNRVTHELLLLLRDNRHDTGARLLAQLAGRLQHADPAALGRAGRKVLRTLRDRGVIAGARA